MESSSEEVETEQSQQEMRRSSSSQLWKKDMKNRSTSQGVCEDSNVETDGTSLRAED